MKFTIEFYEKETGEIPVQEFIDSLDYKMGAKVLSMLEILEEKGNLLREPYSKPLHVHFIFFMRARLLF